MYTCIYRYIFIHIGGLGELVRPVRPPVTGRFGFVSSSFSFRACRACRACGRVEAKLHGCACVDRCPYRWAFLELGSMRSRIRGGDILYAGVWTLTIFASLLLHVW